MVRAFRSELLKLRRWSVLAGGGVMIVATAAIAYLTLHQITSGATGPELTPLIRSFPTTQGLITVVGQARSIIIAIALIIVASNIAAEWSQGTLRNLLVREPGRLRLLSGKMLALLLFMAICLALTLLISGALIIAAAQSQGISTAAWTTSKGMGTGLRFFGNELLCLVGISLLGMLIAVLTRSIGAAVGIALAYVLIPPGPLLLVHGMSTLIWLPVIAIHVFAYIRRLPRSLADDWSNHRAQPAPGRGFRLGVNLGALLGGAIAAILVLPLAASWSSWIKTTGNGPGPFLIIAGMLVTVLALLAARLLRWG